jgi:hypothetical protein
VLPCRDLTDSEVIVEPAAAAAAAGVKEEAQDAAQVKAE